MLENNNVSPGNIIGLRAAGPREAVDVAALHEEEKRILLERIKHEAEKLGEAAQRFALEAGSIPNERLYDYPEEMRTLRQHLLYSLGDFTETDEEGLQESQTRLREINALLKRPENLTRP